MKISNTILAVFQLKNEISAKAAHKFMANLDYSFLRLCLKDTFSNLLHKSKPKRS
jgi:hypothetical protein